MTQAKSIDGISGYEQTGKKEVTDVKRAKQNVYKMAVKRENSIKTLWYLAGKHKVGILLIGNIVLVLNFVLPSWFDMFLGVIGK